MNKYCGAALNQIRIAVDSIKELMMSLREEDLTFRPTLTKFSIGELLEHLSLICEADLLIASGMSKEEMESFYVEHKLSSLSKMEAAIDHSFLLLKSTYEGFSDEQLFEQIKSYWGTVYTRYEWLLEILAHIYHHRGQLHAMLVHMYRKEPPIALFE
ncbi:MULTISPECIES: DinB family protein [Bacillaceae]|uniref:DinB family protein n=1 Tax=Bacillaceae TaxID=186817 RepID=UPI001E2B5E0C|nr:DinB family protein [Bacillus sp. Au-Bac7]MCE4050419.1 DinB family protein [Bacillus sp. Au-Bac7]